MRWVYLSHTIKESTPLYNNHGEVKIERISSILNGDSCNSSNLSMPAHTGTHIDAPYHFDQNGKTLEQYPPDFWFALKPSMIEVKAEPGILLTYQDLHSHLKRVPIDSDILLIKTGAELWREDKNLDYLTKGVGIEVEVVDWIRQNLYLKFLGFDFISLSSPLHRETGRVAHRKLLSEHPSGNNPILIIEDMSLKNINIAPRKVLLIPLRFHQSDGAMITVLAEV